MFENYHKCIPMYSVIGNQHNRLEDVVSTQRETWACTGNWLLPFQITRRKNANSVPLIEIFTEDGTLYEVLNDIAKTNEITIHSVGSRDFIQFRASKSLLETIPWGNYYYKVTAVNTWFSDIFTVYEAATYGSTQNIVVIGEGVLVKDPADNVKPLPLANWQILDIIQQHKS